LLPYFASFRFAGALKAAFCSGASAMVKRKGGERREKGEESSGQEKSEEGAAVEAGTGR